MSANFSILEPLGFSRGAFDIDSEGTSALSNHYIQEARLFGIDKIYFSGEFPSVYFKKVENFEAEAQKEILATHKKVWNQGKVPFLYVESSVEIRVYNCYEKPVRFGQKNRTISDLELYQTTVDDLSKLNKVFGQVSVESGQFWKETNYAKQVRNEQRVEKALIDNLKKTRQKLKQTELTVPVIHNLLLRSLFILYLEDRGATDPPFYQKITGLKNVSSYFEILENKEATYLLFKELDKKFNGNLSPVSEDEETVVTLKHLSDVRACFWSDIYEGGRLFDWRLFDFKVIPIQLLSNIYEDFLQEEDEDGKKKAGAFYTPPPLAEFILNELLPYPTANDNQFNTKVLDPTCGSGIFLVEALNRLLDRWEVANPNKKLTFATICKIVKNNIFGIELNPEAIKVAAFSLYLAMLNRLDPKKLWQNKRLPYLIYEPNEKDSKKQGSNLFRLSSLGSGGFEDVEYDIVVGNPPFKRGDLDEEAHNYLDKKGYAQELVLAFLDRMTGLAPHAKYGLVCGSKPLLFNTGKTYQKFRKFLFNENYVDKIYNFSILRRVTQKEGGRNLFTSAVSPISVIFYSKEFPKNTSEKIMYCAPKTAIKNRIIDGIAIDKTDITYLPRTECQKPETKIWKVAMWGTERDWGVISSLINNNESFANFFKKEEQRTNWNVGAGLHRPDKEDDKCYVENLSEYLLIPTQKIQRYFVDSNGLNKLGMANYREINEDLFKYPLILIKEGLKDKRFCAAYVSFKSVFLNAVYAINGNVSQEILKSIVGYFNSKFSTYYLFFASSTWGVERERVKLNELLMLPYIDFEKRIANKISGKVDAIIKVKKESILAYETEIKVEKLENELDQLIYESLGISNKDQILIEDLFKYNLDAFLNPNKSKAFNPCNTDDTKAYAKHLCQTINEFLDYDEELHVWASVYKLSPRIPLNVVAVYFNQNKKADTVIESPEKQIGQILKDIEQHTYEEHAESIYFRKFLRYHNGKDITYIIKPNEKRFWSRSMGINDADEIIAEILRQ